MLRGSLLSYISIPLLAVVLVCASTAAVSAAVRLHIPDLNVRPGESGTFDALVEFVGSSTPEPFPFPDSVFTVGSYQVRITAATATSGFRIPSAAGGLFGPGNVSEGGDSILASNGILCLSGFPTSSNCAPSYSPGSYLLMRADYQVNPNVQPGTQFSLDFDMSKTSVSNGYGGAHSIIGVDGGVVSVVESDVPVLGGPIAPHDLPANLVVEDFSWDLPRGPISVPLETSNAVITTENGVDLNFSPQARDYTFGAAISQRSSGPIIADFTVNALQAGAWVGGPLNKGVVAEFFSGDVSLGSTTVHSIYQTPVFIGFESSGAYITRAVFSGIGSSTTFALDRLTVAPVEFSLPGDFSDDGIVNTADYTAWRDGLGSVYTVADLEVWKANFGLTAAAYAKILNVAPQAVPEPTLLALLAISGMMFVGTIRQRLNS